MRAGRMGCAAAHGARQLVKHDEVLALSLRAEIILRSDVEGVGSEGEIKQVPVGYWRNFLLPNARAELATSAVLE